MVKATWKSTVLAESGETIVIEGNHYFPPSSVKMEYLKESDYTTTCPWKGKARYHSVEVGGEMNENAAWSYPEPKEKALQIKGYFAFWKGVEVS